MQKNSPTVGSSTKLPGSPGVLPSLKAKQNMTQADDLAQQPRQSRDHSKEKVSFDDSGSLSPEAINDLKRENTSLRIKLHEMQAHTFENSIKAKGIDRSPGAKGLETTLVRANSKMYQLESIIKQKEDQIQQLSYEKRLLENIKKDQGRTIENLMNDKSYYLKAGQDLQAELTTLKKTTIGSLVNENKSLKERLAAYEKKMKSDRDLIARQLQTIKLLDEKNTEISRVKSLTLNPLYDSNKRNEIYRNKNLSDAGAKSSELENIKTLNLAFSSDEVLEKLLEEQDQELAEEEAKIAKSKGENADVVPKEKKIRDYDREYNKLRDIYIETRFEFERIDTRLKEEINNLAKKLNETEDKLREKTKELDMVTHVLDHGKHVNYESMATRSSANRSLNVSKRFAAKVEKHDVSNVGHEPDNQSSFHEDVKEFLKLEGQKSDPIDEKEEEEKNDAQSEKQPEQAEEPEEQKEEEKEEQEEKEEKEEKPAESERKETNFPGGIIVRLGQFNADHTFDDHEALDRANVVKMDSISIWADNKSLIGIQVMYTTKEGKPYEGMKHMGEVTKEKYSKEPWKIEEGDALAKVRGAVAVTHGVIWIEFTTRKGVVKKYGNSEIGKESFNFNFKPSETPLIVMGSFSLRERGEKAAKLNLSALGFTSIEEKKEGKGKPASDKEKASPAKGKATEKDAKGKTPATEVKGKAKDGKTQDTSGKTAPAAETKGKKDSVSSKPEAKKPSEKAKGK